MASEASVPDRTPDKHVEENEITTAKSVQDGAATAATEIGDNCDDNKDEKTPLEGKDDEVVNDSRNATLIGNAIADEKSDCHNPVEPTDQASTEPVYQETRNVVNSSQLVQPATEIGNNSEKQLDLAALKEGDSSILLAAEPTTDVIEKPFGEPPIITIESESESTGELIYNCAEPAPVAKLVEEPEVSNVMDSTTAEAGTLAGVQLIDKNNPAKFSSGSEATSVPPELLEQVEDTTCVLASEKVGNPEFFNRNSSGISGVSEISHMDKDKDMPVGVVSPLDVKEQKIVDDIKHEDTINAEVIIAADKTPETETCVSSEAAISSNGEEKRLTEERGNSESSYAAILSQSEAIETEDTTARTAELVNDDSEKDNVVPGFVENAKEKAGKKVPGSDLETTAEVLTKERILDLSDTSNAPMVESPDFSFDNSDGTSSVSEIDHIQKEEDIPVGVVSKSDVKEQTTVEHKNHKDKVIAEIGITEDKDLETETCVSSEAVISDTVEEKGFSEGREKLESSHAAVSSESDTKATENATTKIEDLVNDNSEKDDVVPVFVENAEEKTGKENSASNLETAIEVLIQERNLNPSETLNASDVGSPEFLSESSKLTSSASEIGLTQEENIGVRVMSKPDAQEQKIVDEEKNTDKRLETGTCVSSEAVISSTVEEKWLSEGREKLESSYAAILSESEAKETENATAKLESFIIDKSEKDNVVPGSVENAEEKAGKKVPASDLETTTEVLTNERILDLSETSNAPTVGSPDFSFENSNGTSSVSEIDHRQKEEGIPVEAVSISDINEPTTVDDKHKDEISAEVGITEDKGLETETCVSSEDVISGTVEEKGFSGGSEKLESSHAALLSESDTKDTENATVKIEDLINDNSGKDNVVPEFVGNAKEKTGKENSASNLETATEVLIKESNINPSETPNASTAGSPEFLSENSKVTYSASEIGHKQEENIPVRVVSASDAQEQKVVDVKKHEVINTEVGATEDKSVETDICISAKALITNSVEEKSESSYDTISSESEAKETESATARIEGLANDENVVSESLENGQEKARKEDLASNMETAMEVLTKEGLYDLSESSNATMAAEITKVDKVDDIPDDFEDPQDLSKMHIASGSVESVIKEVVGSSDDVIAKAIETDVTEVAPITGTLKEELLIQTAGFIADNEGKHMDGTDSGEMVANEELTRGNIVSDVTDKLSAMITREPPKDLSEGNVNVEAAKGEHNANDLKKEDEQKDCTEEICGHDMAELTTEAIDSTPDASAPEQAAPSKTRSPNMISKVKRTLVKAKKAIFGKSPSSKTTSSDTKSEVKS